MACLSKKKDNMELITYRLTLPTDVRDRYDAKTVNLNVDPYALASAEFSRDRMKWPEVTYFDIVNYLVLSTNSYTGEQMKHYKSLEAYKFYQDDWIREVLHKEINGFHLIKAKVTHSMRLSEKPLQPWIIINNDGSINSAHCTCMAGLAEACSHIGAVLFCLETCARVRKETSPTDLPAYWLFPSTTKLKTQFKRVKDMDLESASAKRKNLASASTSSSGADNQDQIKLKTTPPPTEDEKKMFFQKLHSVHPQSAILAISEEFAQEYVPKTLKFGLPPNLLSFYNPELEFPDITAIVDYCEGLDLAITKQQTEVIEEKTRQQIKSKLWCTMRSGRITASNLYAASHTDIKKPSVSLLKKICAPSESIFKSPATDWGIKYEVTARQKYKSIRSELHADFQLSDCGLIMNSEYPRFGASPDGLVTCSCCGDGCVEIKCPYTLKDTSSEIKDISWLTLNDQGKYELKKSHPYYFQVQCQLFLSGRRYCDFVVWCPHLPLIVTRVFPDRECWETALDRATIFHKQCVMPEMCTKFFSKAL